MSRSREPIMVEPLDRTSVTDPLLETRLFIPRWRSGLVSRPGLIERLNRGADRKLILIAAPAGFGKTMLLAQWLAQFPTGRPKPAWVTLEQSDNDPSHFWAYIIAALQTVQSDIGIHTRALLNTSRSAPMESVVATLVNEITTIEHDVILILDDFHVIDAQSVHLAIAYLLEHLPPQMHLVIASRSDPPLPLARLRSRGELTELRATDLRFSLDETAAYFTDVMRLDLSEADIAALESRTEGWIAGMHLAALSMQGHEDTAGFISAFAGDDRFIVDYLAEEVLQRQPEHLRSFLLQTSILARLSGSLADAVTGRNDSQSILETLERGNFLIVRLDDKRRWYRYHHLFADVLSVQLMSEQPGLVTELHRRASEWYEQQGLMNEAIDHALTTEDFERVANLLEMALPAMRRSRQDATVLNWLMALPDDVLKVRPVLRVGYAWTLLASRQLDSVEAQLRDAERWLDPTASTSEKPESTPERMVVANAEEFRYLPGTIAIYRAVLAELQGDVPAAVRYARQVLELSADEDDLRRGAAEALLGLASWACGDLESAHRSFAAGMVRIRRAGNISDAIGGAIVLADIRVAQGRLREAMRTYEHALQQATDQPDLVLRGTADLYVGMSELHREHNDLNAATEHLQWSLELGERTGLPQNRSRWFAAMAHIRESNGDLAGALELLGEAERLYVSDFSPDVHPLAASKARVWIAQGSLGNVFNWAEEHGLSGDDELSYLREFEHITLARALLALGRNDRSDRSIREALALLDRLQEAAVAGGRVGSVIEILILKAIARYHQGSLPESLTQLEQAFQLAEPEGYVRIFTDEGPPMSALIGKITRQRGVADYARQLLRAIENADDEPPVTQHLIEPLSERELDVLRLLGSDLDGPDIAHELLISLNTLRTHTRNIYAKLGVNNRRAAIRRAEELEILPRRRNH